MKGSPVRVRASASSKALQIGGLREDAETAPSEKLRRGQVVGRFGGSEAWARPRRPDHHRRDGENPNHRKFYADQFYAASPAEVPKGSAAECKALGETFC
jgi:hypothetical protein